MENENEASDDVSSGPGVADQGNDRDGVAADTSAEATAAAGGADAGADQPDARRSVLDLLTAPLRFAYGVSTMAGHAFDSRGPADSWHVSFPDDDEAARLAAIVELAAFVRENKDAGPEILWRHAWLTGLIVDGGDPDGFDDLPLARRLAFAAFRESLLLADRMVAAEAAAEPVPVPPKGAPEDKTRLKKRKGRGATSALGEAVTRQARATA